MAYVPLLQMVGEELPALDHGGSLAFSTTVQRARGSI